MKLSISIIILFLLFTSCNKNKKETVYAKKGIIYIDALKLKNNSVIKLNGEWEFYDNKLYSPDSFKLNNFVPEYINLPSLGKKSKLRKKTFSTFRLKLIIHDLDFNIALLSNKILLSHNIWLNGKQCNHAGTVSDKKETYKPELKISFTKIPPELFKNDTLEIIVQTANFDGPITGIVTPFKIEEYNNAYKNKTIETSFFFSVLSIVFVFGLFSLTIFIIRRKERPSLYLFGLSIIFILFGLSTNDTLLKNIFSSNFSTITRLTHICVSLYPAMIILFINSLYKKEINKKILYLTVIISFLLIIFSATANIHFLLDFLFLKEMFVFASFSYITTYILPSTIIHKKRGALLSFAGTLFLSATSINDILFSINYINTGYYSIYGFLIFYIFQALNLVTNFTKSLLKNDELFSKLDFQNKNLEKIVVERTKEVHKKQKEILARNHKLEMQNQEILKQREAIFYKNEKIKHQNMQTNSSISYARTIQKAILPHENELKDKLEYFILDLPKEKISGDFYWFSIIKNHKNNNETSFIAVIDCTGHGVPGAFMSVLGNMILNNIINKQGYKKPSDILNKMNNEIIKTLKQDSNNNTDGMDVCLCRIDRENEEIKQIVFSGAKSPLYYIENSGKIIRIKGSPKPIGGIIDSDFDFYYTDTVITPKKGDSFFLTSDGYIDQNNPERQRFGTVKLMKLLKIIYKRPVLHQKTVLLRELKDFMEKENQRDDITILGVKI